MSDTPRSNNYDWSFHLLFAESQKMERELNAANERIKRLEEELERTKQDRNAIAKKTREPLLLKLDHAAERIKRLEEAGDAMEVFCDAVAAHNWRKAKEAKP
jgi:chromosome segregation ATPase